MYLHVYKQKLGIRAVILTEKERKQHSSPGDDASTAEAARGRVGKVEQKVNHDEQTAHRLVDLISTQL